MTLAEKILARASGEESVTPGQYVTAEIDVAMAHEGLAPVYAILSRAGIKKPWDPDRIVAMLDHYVPATSIRAAEGHKLARRAVADYGIKNYYGERGGVCHQVMVEKGHVVPGELVVGTDSHTTTYGALGVASTGIGISEMAYVFATGNLWFKVPPTIRFELSGTLMDRVMSKDVILHIAGAHSAEVAQYKSVEFVGPAVAELSVGSRMTISNMAVEIGAKFGLFETDRVVLDYLAGRTDKPVRTLAADADAQYEQTFSIDLSTIGPQIALPPTVDNVKPVSQCRGIRMDQAVIGSCTNGRLEDLQVAADILRGKQVHDQTRLLVVPASWDVYRDALGRGILRDLVDAGAIVCNSSCGPCFGGHLGLLGSGEKCISSTNRNFRGRMGSNEAEVYLASPATVAASAVAGEIVDPREA